MLHAAPAPRVFARDAQFWAAVAGAIVFWIALDAATRPQWDLTWPLHRAWLFVQLALLYPVAEEIVFRGAIQPWLARRTGALRLGPVSLANGVTSLLFAALHFYSHPALWAAAVFIPSLLLGYFRERHASLWPPIALHVFFNGGYFWLFGA
jgi:uncharacterized protein